MPRTNRPPSYRHHKARDCAVVTIRGKNFYLGKYGSPESKQRYGRLIAEWEAGEKKLPPIPRSSHRQILRVKDLILRYFHFAQVEYVDENGKPTNEICGVRTALRRLRNLFGDVATVEFGPKSLKIVQHAMVEEDLSRAYINDSVNRVRRMFKWAVSEELIPAAIHQALKAVVGLSRKRKKGRQTKRIKPVDDNVVTQTLPHAPRIIADMVRFQRLTSCRPGEVCIVKPELIDRSSDVWEYDPEKHKTEHMDKKRIIFIGPQAQDVLRPYLLREETAYCFSPKETVRQRNARARANRKSRRRQTHKPVENPQRIPGDFYSTDSYRCAIHRACDKAFPAPEDLDKQAKEKWRKQHRWSPNRLRHTAGTEIGDKFGLEAASTVMGNTVDVAQLYVERNLKQAREIIREVG